MPHFYRPQDFQLNDHCDFGELDGRPVLIKGKAYFDMSDPEAPERLGPGTAFSDEFGFVSQDRFFRYLNRMTWSRCENEAEQVLWVASAAKAYFEMQDWSLLDAWPAFVKEYRLVAAEPHRFEQFVAAWHALDLTHERPVEGVASE